MQTVNKKHLVTHKGAKLQTVKRHFCDTQGCQAEIPCVQWTRTLFYQGISVGSTFRNPGTAYSVRDEDTVRERKVSTAKKTKSKHWSYPNPSTMQLVYTDKELWELTS